MLWNHGNIHSLSEHVDITTSTIWRWSIGTSKTRTWARHFAMEPANLNIAHILHIVPRTSSNTTRSSAETFCSAGWNTADSSGVLCQRLSNGGKQTDRLTKCGSAGFGGAWRAGEPQTDRLTKCGSAGFDSAWKNKLSKPAEPHLVNRSVCCSHALQAPPKPAKPHVVNRSVCFPPFLKRCQSQASHIVLIHRFCFPTFDTHGSLGRFEEQNIPQAP